VRRRDGEQVSRRDGEMVSRRGVGVHWSEAVRRRAGEVANM